jgi:3-dehydroquinate synthase
VKQFTVNAPSGSYAVVCGRGLLARVASLLEPLEEITTVFLFSSPRVWKLWGRPLEASLRRQYPTKTILFDDRESAKSLATFGRLCRALARAGADRRSVVVGLGGGVVGDVAGFVAASYARGIRLVHVPSTLLAQVDSSIGGKTAVNLPEGKNLVGAFYQPGLVVTDPRLLATLPARHYRSGLYEVIKYAVLGDEILFAYLERRLDDLLRQRPQALAWVLERCIRAKAEVVSADERESGLRLVLNFGHTFGHALEAATRFRKFLHGEAVAWGMIAAARLSAGRKMLPSIEAARIERLIHRVGRLPVIARIPASRLLGIMRGDKKSRVGHLRLVLARAIGRVEVVADVPEELVLEVWRGLSV